MARRRPHPGNVAAKGSRAWKRGRREKRTAAEGATALQGRMKPQPDRGRPQRPGRGGEMTTGLYRPGADRGARRPDMRRPGVDRERGAPRRPTGGRAGGNMPDPRGSSGARDIKPAPAIAPRRRAPDLTGSDQGGAGGNRPDPRKRPRMNVSEGGGAYTN